MTPEEQQRQFEELKEQYNRLRRDFDDLLYRFNKDDFSNKYIYRQDVEISKTNNLYILSDTGGRSEIRFDYEESVSGRLTRYKIYQEENGGSLIIESVSGGTIKLGGGTAAPTATHIKAVDEIDLLATDTFANGFVTAKNGTATTAGGVKGFMLGSAGIAICWGSGAPSLSAPKGSLYLRSDGSGTTDRAYINTNGTTTWTAITTVA